jgi:hypothetical protein
MGTNFYGRRKRSTIAKMEIIEAVVQNNFEEAARLVNLQVKKQHIGKSSAGWKFLFNKMNDAASCIEGYKDYLKQFYIEDEYGTEYTFEEFWEKVELKQKWKSASDEYDPSNYTMIDGYEFSNSPNFC